jgi:signal transduction histidine kinase
LENAIAASPKSSTITIRAAPTELNGQPALSISFVDEGSGLTEEQRERIFTPFFTTKTKGTGLGMAIAQRIIHSHHGQISASNSEAGGAKIKVLLPRVRS